MKLSLGADEPTAVVDFVLDELIRAGHNVTYYGPRSGDAQPVEENARPMVARRVAEDVAAGRLIQACPVVHSAHNTAFPN